MAKGGYEVGRLVGHGVRIGVGVGADHGAENEIGRGNGFEDDTEDMAGMGLVMWQGTLIEIGERGLE